MTQDLSNRTPPRATSAAAALLFLVLATGSPPPSEAAGTITDQDLAERTATARTADDHQALAVYFRAKAATEVAQMELHERMLESYRKVSGTPYARMKEHCGHLIRSHRRAKKQFEDLAAEHAAVAKSLSGQE